MSELQNRGSCACGSATTPAPKHWLKALRVVLLALILLGLGLLATYKIWLPKILGACALYELRDKNLSTVSVPRTLDTQVATTSSFTLGDLSFKTPWKTIVALRGNGTSTLALSFQDDPKSPGELVFIFKGLFSLHDKLIGSDVQVQNFFGSQLSTNYDLYNYIVNLTPKDVHLLGSNQDILAKIDLLTAKDIFMPAFNPPVYSFTTQNDIRGFQFMLSATSTDVEFFTPKDQEYSLLITRATQQEVDSILQSIQEGVAISTTSASSAGGCEEQKCGPMVMAVQQAEAGQFQVAPNDIEVIKVAPTQWPDSCMGLAGEGDMCAQVVTNGYVIRFKVRGSDPIYELHTDQNLKTLEFAGALPHCSEIGASTDPTSCW